MKALSLCVVVVLLGDGLHLMAQNLSVESVHELQTNFEDCNYVTFLRFEGALPLFDSLALDVATISVAKTRPERLVNDLQTFSNIEEDNLPLALAVCGVAWNPTPNHSFFLGVRNMNEDYFASEVTSFFCNSSCGVYPTISANYSIANYPVASMGAHYAFSSEHVGFLASVYNGRGYKDFAGRENVFRFRPKTDGVFGLAQVEVKNSGGSCFLGAATYCDGQVGVSPWIYWEQRLCDCLQLLVGGSLSFGRGSDCTSFCGAGLLFRGSKADVGLFSDYAHFGSAKEWATELSCRLSISEHLYWRPVAHLILSENHFRAIGCVRFGFDF